MHSKVSYDLDQYNNPVIKVEAVSSPDVRDKIAKRFVETFAHGDSQWAEVVRSGEGEYTIWPIKPEELRAKAIWMLQKADELEEAIKKRTHVELTA